MSELSHESSIFNAARKIERGANRDDYVTEACGGDSALQERVEKLLSAYDAESQFLEQPAAELDPTIIPDTAGSNRADSLQAGLAAAFREDQSVVLGSAGHSVLKSLGDTIDNVPHVMLRDGDGDDPITKPSSPEIPNRDADSRYRFDGEIARGGMGAILKGRDNDLGRDLAIKVLLDSHKGKPEVIQRFVEEAQIGGQLQHPGIAPIYELGQFSDKRPFFAMKLVKGETLSKLLAQRKEPAEERGRFLGIFEQVCQTMAYAHSRGVIHRDLKPANIMVGAFGEVQVMDWGLAKVLSSGGVADEKKAYNQQQGQSVIQTLRSVVGSDAPGTFGTIGSQTQMGSVMGTPAYMPPEQALGEIDNLDERADVFGLGAILCEVLTGKPPYVGDNGTQVYRMASRGKLDDASSRLDACGADEDLIALTKDCLELEPVDRPRDAGVLAERVTGYLESVEAKLRDAEVQRAAEAARADAEAAQADAERQRAEAESQRAEAQAAKAEAESARANEESKRRRTSLALAASVLLLISLGGGGWLSMERQEANRQMAEAAAQRKHAAEMQTLAEQRDEQRKAAEAATEVAEKAQQLAEAAEEEGRKLLYATDMQLVDALLKDEEFGAGQILSRLNAHDPDRPDNLNPGEDLRGFEWHYFKSVLEKRSTIFDGFDQPVVGSALTGEGELVTLDNDGKLRRFDAATRIETRPALDLKEDRVRGFFGGLDWFTAKKALSADGRMAALAVGDKVHLVDTTTGAELAPAIKAATRYGTIFSPDTAMLITVDAKIAWWDTATGRQIAMTDSFLENAPAPVSVSADGLTVAIGFQGGSAQSWSAYRMDPDTGNVAVLQDRVSQNGASIRTLAVTPDGKSVAIAMLLSSHLFFYDIRSGKEVGGNSSEHVSSIATIGFNPKNHEMVTGSIDGVLKYWKDYRQLLSAETRDAPETRSLQGHDQSIVQALIAADGKRIISSSLDQTTRIWDTQTQTASQAQPVSTLTSQRSVYSPDGLLIVGAGGDQEIRVCEAATGRLVHSIHVEGTEPLEVVAVSPDNHQLAICRGELVELWDMESGQLQTSLPPKAGEPYVSIAFSPDGKHLVTGIGQFGTYMAKKYESVGGFPIAVYDVAAGRLIHEMKGHRNRVMNITFSRDGKLLASASHDRTARIWDTATWQTIHVLANPDTNTGTGGKTGVEDVAFSPDGTRLAMASLAGNVHVFDTQSGDLVETLRGHAGMVNAVRFSPDGRTLVSGGADDTVRLWNTATWRQLTTLASSSPGIGPRSLRFSPDGGQLLAAGPRTVFWSTQSGAVNQLERLANNLRPLLESKSLFRNRVRLLSEDFPLHEALELLDPEEPLVQVALAATRANWHASHERWTEAVDEFERLTELNPESQPSWLQVPGLMRLHRAYLEQDQPARAAEILMTTNKQVVDNEDASAADQLAELLLETVTPWTVLTPTEMTSEGGATLTLQADGSILASGKNPDQDAYQITAEIPPQRITAIRLEVIPDASLPLNGPGRAGNGNFHLNELRVLINGQPHTPAKIVASYGEVGHELYRHIIDGTIDANHWGTNPRPGEQHSAVILTDIDLADDDSLTLELVSSRGHYPQHNLGRFRLSVSDDPSAYENTEKRFVAMKLTDPWSKLASAYKLIGDQLVLDKLLEQHPAAAASIGDLYAMDENWQQAIELYSEVITDQTTDVTLLTKRAAAYIATEQWKLAKADWQRAVALKPDQTQAAFDQFQQAQRWAEAIAFGEKLIEINPNETLSWLNLAPVAALAGNETYRDFCRRCAQQFKGTTDARVAERIIKACLLKPGSVDLETLPRETLAKALDEETAPDRLRPWAWASRAMLAYRRGDAESAVNYVANSEALKPHPQAHLLNLALLALAEHQLEHTEKSRLAFEELLQHITQGKADTQNVDLFAEILFREAKAKINDRREVPSK